MDKVFDVDDTEEDINMDITPNQSLISTPGSAVRSSPDPASHACSDSRKFDTQFGETDQSDRSGDSKVNVGLDLSVYFPSARILLNHC
ncbi:hypothetical protein Y032_0002g639 [Ancylostoma ceylanicum]|nr:hypothetical protein Y032_0002g639 [Ancylostoma ceylanicum]